MTPQRKRSGIRPFVRFDAALLLLAACGMLWSQAATPNVPSPTLAPNEVVRLQLDALKHNDRPRRDSGVATVFRFTSPGNRALTGPLPHFAQMIHFGYAAMLDHQWATLEAIVIKGDRAMQRVELIDHAGTMHRYVFVLSRQQEPPYRGCWMTDSVLTSPDERPSRAL